MNPLNERQRDIDVSGRKNKHTFPYVRRTVNQEYLKEIFDYHPDGYFTWKISKSGVTIGMIAGQLIPHRLDRYCKIQLQQKFYKTHHLVFLYHHGYIPQMVDHIDGNSINNRIENLRPCTAHQNSFNTKGQPNKTSIYKGVCWNKKYGLWIAQIYLRKKRTVLGFFEDQKEAALAYNRGAVRLFNEFAYLNIVQP